MKSSYPFRSVLALGLLVGLTASAHAAADFEGVKLTRGPSKTVRFADLDISKVAGVETLYSRIRAAARSVCQGEVREFYAECRAKAVDDAVAGVGNTLLAAVHRAATAGEEVASRRL
jgi:UrcA family protein